MEVTPPVRDLVTVKVDFPATACARCVLRRRQDQVQPVRIAGKTAACHQIESIRLGRREELKIIIVELELIRPVK